ncbi:PAS domain S-box protein [Desulfomonile tiedjei]|uniref:histidine kinase n=1 Tax=Desulfomonile tiedjei (strain ATCC 49306 / DSM 6799 / DCB-1) TaxID=706587 RepID=I4C7Z4_DESTA|nr:PAS domain S-box protein [Desulfomonile tiedjei]AFM25685.1 PAS domain S-box [Desulfomonile tiedjei DSM 6799]
MVRSLSTKAYLALALGLLFVVLSVVVVMLVNSSMKRLALNDAEHAAGMLLDHNLAIHSYFSQDLKPRLFHDFSAHFPENYFDPIWMSSTYAVRKVDKYFHQLNKNPYYYKECAINARSPENEADDYEKAFLADLQNDPTLMTKTAIRVFDDKPFFTLLRRGEVMEESCLRCHSSPEKAPGDMVAQYGPERSFHKKIDEVAQAISIRIPLSEAFSSAAAFSSKLSGLLLLAMGSGVFFMWLGHRKLIINPLSEIQEQAVRIASEHEHLGDTIPEPKIRELRDLVAAFNQMSKELQKTYQQQEQTIQERMAELTRTNLRLTQEIIERKTAQEALRNSEERFRKIFEQGPTGIAILDLDFRWVSVNAKLCEMVQYTEEQLTELTLIDITHPDDTEIFFRENKKLLSGEITCNKMAKRCIRKDGKILWINLTESILRDDQGKPLYFLIMLEDISHRKMVEEALIESEEKYRRLHETLIDAFVCVDMKGRILETNQAYQNMLGYSEEELCTLNNIDLTPSKWHAFEANIVQEQILVKGYSDVYEKEYRKKDGTVFPIELRRFLIRDDLGHPLAMWAIVRDITERKLAEKALRESEGRYRSLFENMLEGFAYCRMLFENEKPQDFVYLDVNDAFEKLTGLKDVIGKKVSEVIPGICESNPELFEIYGRVSLTATPEKFETYVDALGIWFSISVYSTEKGTFVAVFDNITERKQAEAALKESEEHNRFLAEVIEFSSQPFASGNSDGSLVFFNRAYYDLIGYSREEACRIDWIEDVTPPEYRDMEYSKLAHLAETGEPVRYEKEYIRKDGSRIPVELLAHVTKDCNAKRPQFYAFITDLSGHKAVENALRTSEAQLSNALAMAQLGHWEYDFATDLFTFNDNFYRLFRTTADQVGGYTMSSAEYVRRFVHPDDSHVIADEIRKCAEICDFSPDDLEHRTIFANGEIGYIVVRCFVTRDNNGRAVKTYGVSQDVTERKKAQESIEREKNRLKVILDVFNDGVYIVNAQRTIEYVNPVIESTFGLVNGKKCHEYIHQSPKPCPSCWTPEILAGQSAKRELHVERIGKTFEVFETPIKNDDGSVLKLVFFHDITDRKRAEEDRVRLVTAIEQAAETVVMTDTKGTILYVNPAFERTTGYSSLEAIGNNPRILKSGQHDAPFYENLWKTISSGAVWSGHFITKKKDGTLFEEEATISPVKDDSGKIVNYVAVKRDVTTEVSLQKQLLQAQKMEAIGTLAGGIAHDFNNLLQVILGYSELLLQDKREQEPDYSDLKKIFQSAQNGAELVRRLLTFSRKVEPQFAVMNLNRQIMQIDRLLQRTIPKMICINLQLSNDINEIYADATQMEQILMNLAVNARDAMPDGGKLTITTTNITLDDEYCKSYTSAVPGDYVLLTVADTGHGMDKKTIEHMFEPFYTTKELGRGTGLGLAIVYGIVSQHGGHITCYSEVGRGTEFKVYLPAIPAEIQPSTELSGEMPAFGTETVLLVDDEEFVRELGDRILSKNGYKVLTAANGMEALKAYSQHKDAIAMIILDLVMPTMGGKDCLHELRKIDPRVKVLVASGYSADATVQEVLDLGVKGFVSKPFRFKDLLRQVRKALDEP